MPKKTSPEVIAAAVQSVREGHSYASVAEAAGVTEITVGRWVRAARGPDEPKPLPIAQRAKVLLDKAHGATDPGPELPPPGPPIDPTDLPGTLRSMMAQLLQDADRMRREGYEAKAVAAMAAAGRLAPTLKQLEAIAADGADMIRISQADIRALKVKMLERFKAICDRPLLCAKCNRELATEWGESGRAR
jgi:transposase-like protein